MNEHLEQTRIARHQEKLKVLAKRNSRILKLTTIIALVSPTALSTTQTLAAVDTSEDEIEQIEETLVETETPIVESQEAEETVVEEPVSEIEKLIVEVAEEVVEETEEVRSETENIDVEETIAESSSVEESEATIGTEKIPNEELYIEEASETDKLNQEVEKKDIEVLNHTILEDEVVELDFSQLEITIDRYNNLYSNEKTYIYLYMRDSRRIIDASRNALTYTDWLNSNPSITDKQAWIDTSIKKINEAIDQAILAVESEQELLIDPHSGYSINGPTTVEEGRAYQYNIYDENGIWVFPLPVTTENENDIIEGRNITFHGTGTRSIILSTGDDNTVLLTVNVVENATKEINMTLDVAHKLIGRSWQFDLGDNYYLNIITPYETRLLSETYEWSIGNRLGVNDFTETKVANFGDSLHVEFNGKTFNLEIVDNRENFEIKETIEVVVDKAKNNISQNQDPSIVYSSDWSAAFIGQYEEYEDGVGYYYISAPGMQDDRHTHITLSDVGEASGLYRNPPDHEIIYVDDGIEISFYKVILKAIDSSDPDFIEEPVTGLVDQETGVKVTTDSETAFPSEASLSVAAVTEGSVVSSLDSLLSGQFRLYDINLLDENNQTIQPVGTVNVYLPIPDSFDSSKLQAYHYDETANTLTALNGTVEGSYYVFETSHFSYFVLEEVNDETNEDIEDTEDPEDATDDTPPDSDEPTDSDSTTDDSQTDDTTDSSDATTTDNVENEATVAEASDSSDSTDSTKEQAAASGVLPQTGERSSILFTVSGLVIVLIGLSLLLQTKRKKA